jgi:hypothetical protein
VAETNGLLNRRTGKSGTEGSNPSVSAIHSIITKTYVESVGLPTFLPTFKRRLATVYLAPRNTPHPLQKPSQTRPHRGGTPPNLVDGTRSSFLHIILRVRLAWFYNRGSLSGCRPYPDWSENLTSTKTDPAVVDLIVGDIRTVKPAIGAYCWDETPNSQIVGTENRAYEQRLI